MQTKPLPTSLKVVAWFFILAGVYALIEVAVGLFNDRVSINLWVLGLFIGPGLLRLSRGWRTCALVFIWIALIGSPIAALLSLAAEGPLDVKLLGQPVGHIPRGVGLLVAAAVLEV